MVTPSNLTTGNARTPKKIFLLIISLVGIIGTLVSFGLLIFSIGKQVIITDDEFIMGERYYELESCQYNDYDGKESTKATPAEIAQCKEEKTAVLIQSRNATFKQDVLGGAIRGVLFLGLLLISYPKFMKLSKKD